MKDTVIFNEKRITMNSYNPVNLPVPEGIDLSKLIGEYEEQGNPTRKFKYMPASSRIAWYRANEPDSPMPVTELISDNNGVILFKATLFDIDGNIRATATGADSVANHSQNEAYKAYETADTKAIGRCLRFLGYGIGIQDEGDEKDPIDQPTPTEPIKSISEMIENDEDIEPDNKPSPTTIENTKVFAEMSDVEKGVAAILTPFPIGFTIAGTDYKAQPLYRIVQALKQDNPNKNPFETVQNKLNWGLERKLSAVVNSEINLKYPEYASFVVAMLNDLELYNKAISEVKNQIYSNKETAA